MTTIVNRLLGLLVFLFFLVLHIRNPLCLVVTQIIGVSITR